MSLTFATYLIAGLALTGTPLLPGYISKTNLLTAAAQLNDPYALFGIVSLLLSALLTAAYLLPMSVRAYIVPEGSSLSFTEKDRDPGLRMLIPFGILILAMVIFGVHSGPLMDALSTLVHG